MTEQTAIEAFVSGDKLDVPTALCHSRHMAVDTLSSHVTIGAGSKPVKHSVADRPNLSPDCRVPPPEWSDRQCAIARYRGGRGGRKVEGVSGRRNLAA